uniref:Uncharacterized protein n=1 Tax=uncultured marine thaumarchaeote KM3_145_B06 TaxID=1456011 RepID=A0A075GI77_9ARCH|nr:hypothetical protein [uncultured marine thaumarchaeote KM3_145_B06]
MDDSSGLPVASLFCAPMIVERPISCIVIEVPAPTRLLSPPSFENERHSGPPSVIFSVSTNPQTLQNNSPVVSSKTILALVHAGHRCLPKLLSI